jgi:hypothetical protein
LSRVNTLLRPAAVERVAIVGRNEGQLWSVYTGGCDRVWAHREQHDARDGRYPMTLVWGRYDTLHSPNLRRWMCKQPKSAAVASTSTSTSSAVAAAAAAASAADGVDQTNAAPRKVHAPGRDACYPPAFRCACASTIQSTATHPSSSSSAADRAYDGAVGWDGVTDRHRETT